MSKYQRPALLRFADEMEAVLRDHDPDKGNSWERMTVPALLSLVREEMKELEEAIDRGDMTKVPAESVDVANVLMMLGNRADGWPFRKATAKAEGR